MQFDQLKRREFITLLGGTVAAGSMAHLPAAMAQQPGKMPRVGILTPAATDATPVFEGFRKGLRELGYVEQKTILLDFRFARGNVDSLPALADELVRIPVDVIVADALPPRAPR
jgi:putative ABC transport system substrate-binding protein